MSKFDINMKWVSQAYKQKFRSFIKYAKGSYPDNATIITHSLPESLKEEETRRRTKLTQPTRKQKRTEREEMPRNGQQKNEEAT